MSEGSHNAPNKGQSQLDKFRDAARELGTDDDPERFAATVRKLAKAKPVPPEKLEKAKKTGDADR